MRGYSGPSLHINHMSPFFLAPHHVMTLCFWQLTFGPDLLDTYFRFKALQVVRARRRIPFWAACLYYNILQ